MRKRRPNITLRYTVLAAAFAIICFVYVIVLAAVLIKGPQTEYAGDDGTVTRTVTVSGLRGEIYDRKGRLLVGNSTEHNLLYEYGAMPDTYAEINKELLAILTAISETGNSHTLPDDYFPLSGTYPDVSYTAAVSDSESYERFYLQRTLKRLEMDESSSAKELAKHYVTKYKLTDKLYTDSEIMTLMRLWYDMERIGFGAFQGYTMAKNVNMELVTYVEEAGIEGATFTTVSERVYTYPGVASHILGRLGKITAEDAEYYSELGYPMDAYVGTSGCELAFESILHGQDGVMVLKYDADGNMIDKYYETEPISGNDVWLTIDIDVQIAAEKGLAEAAESVDTSKGGAITAINPNTGAILAIASYPTYDLEQFSSVAYYNSLLEDSKTPLLNRALQGVYAPGSTYKIGVALTALENDTINTYSTFNCNGAYPHLHNPTCLASHGSTDVYEAIQESCNVFFYTLGHRMGIEAVTEYTQKLGLGAPTGIELSEKTGIVAGPEYRKENDLGSWGAGDDVSAAIGQSDHGYTPLQLSVYMASVVNGGTRYNAHILDSVRSFYTKEPITVAEPVSADSVSISKGTYTTLMEAMGRVVSENSEIYRYFRDLPVKAGGKTGTAEVAGKYDYALFSGFAPLKSPEIVVSCIIEEGQHGYYASIAVARTMEEYFSDK